MINYLNGLLSASSKSKMDEDTRSTLKLALDIAPVRQSHIISLYRQQCLSKTSGHSKFTF